MTPALMAGEDGGQPVLHSLANLIARGRFELHYQPIVGLTRTTEAVSASEALLRLKVDDRFISPEVFIPWLEQTGRMDEMNLWVISEAARESVRSGQRVSVNLNPGQLHDGLVRHVDRTLDHLGLERDRMTFELTEQHPVDADTATAVAKLAALGVGIYLDDFGSGFASYGILRKLPLTGLKIDRALIQQLNCPIERYRAESVVASVREVANAFGLSLVAEGIETQPQLEAVKTLGIRWGQGFLLGRPQPPTPKPCDLVV